MMPRRTVGWNNCHQVVAFGHFQAPLDQFGVFFGVEGVGRFYVLLHRYDTCYPFLKVI